MKTLKQIREEYKEKYVSQVEHLPEEVMLEKSLMPSSKQMPAIIIFKRVSFRSYPKGQVVALYYSNLMNKYLSVPIGPGDSVNLSEAEISDNIDEACWSGYQQKGMKKKGDKMVPNCVPVEEQGSSATRYTERPTYEGFKVRIDKLRKEKEMNEDLSGAITGAIKGYASGGLTGALKSGFKGLLKPSKPQKGKKPKPTDTDKADMAPEKSKPTAKITSSWENRPTEDPVYASRAKQAYLRSTNENKITDIRSMVKEGIDNMDLSINGRSVTLNTSMAKRILEVYDSVNTKNKKIVESMLNEDLESFKKLLNFSIKA